MLLRSQMQHLFSANLGEMHFSNCSSISEHFLQHFSAFLVKVHFQNCFRKNPKSGTKTARCDEVENLVNGKNALKCYKIATKMLKYALKNANIEFTPS